jgi:hypothetical protein
MHTTLTKMLEQGLFKGITAIGFILQYKERIMAIILAITLAKRQIGKHIAQVTMESFPIQLNELYTGLSSQVTQLMKVEASKYAAISTRLWDRWQWFISTNVVLDCPSLL